MKTTFILKDLTDEFYNGGFWSIGLSNLNKTEQFLYLTELARRKELKITLKVGNSNSFRDMVELNQKVRGGVQVQSGQIEPRRGYKLATFEIV